MSNLHVLIMNRWYFYNIVFIRFNLTCSEHLISQVMIPECPMGFITEEVSNKVRVILIISELFCEFFRIPEAEINVRNDNRKKTNRIFTEPFIAG